MRGISQHRQQHRLFQLLFRFIAISKNKAPFAVVRGLGYSLGKVVRRQVSTTAPNDFQSVCHDTDNNRC